MAASAQATTQDKQLASSIGNIPCLVSDGGFQQQQDFFRCPVAHCPRFVRTEQGLKAHITRLHKSQKDASRVSQTQDPLPHNIKTSEGENSSDISRETRLEETLGILRSSSKILRRIPKGARAPAALALTEAILKCTDSSSVKHWRRLLLFSSICFPVPDKSLQANESLTTSVKKNILAYKADTQPSALSVLPTHKNGPSSGPARASVIQAKLAEGDIRGAVRIISSSDTFAPMGPETLNLLQSLHPASQDPVSPVSLGDPSEDSSRARLQGPFLVSESQVRGALQSFPTGSAGGLDLLRPQHLKDLISHSAGVAGRNLLTALTKLCNVMLAGEVPPEICPTLYGATLCAFNKASGGIRPIAIGNTFRRLVAKLCSFHLAGKLDTILAPQQFGFGIKGGLEIATHLARRFVSYEHDSFKVFLKIDFRNAFNLVNREVFRTHISNISPDISHFVTQCYGSPTSLVYGSDTIPSCRGVQQGDPLGPALFCLALQPLAASLKSPLNVWYLDDGSLGGDLHEVFQDFCKISDESGNIGLELNPEKCELFCLGASPGEEQQTLSLFQSKAPSLRISPTSECRELGTPLFQHAVARSVEDKTKTLCLLASRLPDVQAHYAYVLLKHSLAIPKLTHLLRCSPTWLCQNELQAYDDSLREALSCLLNVYLSDQMWNQTSWPSSKGGLGIRHSRALALPAFLSSVHSTKTQVDALLPAEIAGSPDPLLAQGLLEWETMSGCSVQRIANKSSQSEWEQPLFDKSFEEAFETAPTPLDKARLLGVSQRESGAFLNAIPSPTIGTFLDNESFRVAISVRLGAKVVEPHTCVCGSRVDERGLHGLSCRRNAGRLLRHSSANDVIRRALASADVASTLEPSHLSLQSNIRPDGVTHVPWSGGRTLVWDFTCSDGLAPSHLEYSSGIRLHAASTAENTKRAKYAELAQTHLVVPVAVECLGGIGASGLSFLQEIGRRITAHTGDKRATEYLLQRISIVIQRGNAASVLGTFPRNSDLSDVIY